MLSSQTKDHVTASAMTRLQNHGLTVESIYGTSQEIIEEMIRPVGFYRVCFDFITLQWCRQGGLGTSAILASTTIDSAPLILFTL